MSPTLAWLNWLVTGSIHQTGAWIRLAITRDVRKGCSAMIRRLNNHLILLGALLMALMLFLVAWTSGSAHAILTAHLHEGSCADLGDQPKELGELGYDAPLLDLSKATPAGPYKPVGPDAAFPTVLGHVTVDQSLDELLDTPHAIDVHIVNEEQGVDITLACGAVGGIRGDSQLVFGLQSLPNEGVDTTGIAWLEANEDDTTTVRVFVAQGLAAGGYGAVTGTPTPAP